VDREGEHLQAERKNGSNTSHFNSSGFQKLISALNRNDDSATSCCYESQFKHANPRKDPPGRSDAVQRVQIFSR
jgi:hypothetical protein